MQSGQDTDAVKVRGRVEAVFYAGPCFSAGKLRTDEGGSIQFAGRVFVQIYERVILRGKWVKHPKYGDQLQVESLQYDLEVDTGGLAHYIATHPAIKGIGPVKARVIVDQFGRDLERTLTEDPETVAKAAKVSLETVKRLRTELRKTRDVNQAITWLASFGLTHHQVTSLVDKFGNDVLGLFQADPYLIAREIPGFGFKRVDTIARKIGTLKEHPPRIRAGILHCVNEALVQGDCWTEYQDLIEWANRLLVMDTMDSLDLIEQELDSLIEKQALTCTSYAGRFLVAKPHIHKMESDLGAIFCQGNATNPNLAEGQDLGELISRFAPELNSGQRVAVRTALRHTLSVISGGAGSGKTYTISAITQICESLGCRVILAAPTGKAAKRLEEMVGHTASTIHRLLGYNSQSYARGPDNPLEADIVIIDEASMVDVPLAWHLFQAVDLERTAIVLVGDHNQLPPVGPGNLLRDLIDTRVLPTVVLDHVVRQAGILKENSIAILAGQVPKTSGPEADGHPVWHVTDQFTDPKDVQHFILDLFENVLQDRLGYHLVDDIQVLTPTHKGPLGTRELNVALQRLIQKKEWGVDVPLPRPSRRPQLLLHDKVIQNRNNYETGVMNGSIGVVSQVGHGGKITVNFDATAVGIEPGTPNMRDIQLAYALTIHKAQGSEFPCVIMVVHKSHAFMHHRNLFYTGVTRATKTAIIIGDQWGIRNCARTQQLGERKTFLSLTPTRTLEEVTCV